MKDIKEGRHDNLSHETDGNSTLYFRKNGLSTSAHLLFLGIPGWLREGPTPVTHSLVTVCASLANAVCKLCLVTQTTKPKVHVLQFILMARMPLYFVLIRQ